MAAIGKVNVTARSRPAASLRCESRRVDEARRGLALLLLGFAGLPASAPAQDAASDSRITREVVSGVTHRRVMRPGGPWVLNVIEVDLRRPELAIRGVRACDRLVGRERPSAISRRLRKEGIDVIAVLNADFFDLRGGTGATKSNVIVDGEIVKAVRLTDSPFDAFDNVHTQFGITTARIPVLDRFQLEGTVRTPSGEWPLGGVNAVVPGAISLLTRWSDSAVLAATPALDGARVALLKVGGRGDTAHYRVDSTARNGAAPFPSGQLAVLVGSGDLRSPVERLRPGDRVTIVARFAPGRGTLRTLVGGWPRIVQSGQNVALAADSIEGTVPRFSRARHPRTAIGISRDSATVYLVTVDGRQKASVGMTLEELADAMIALGAYEAMNFDGGGSTALVVRDSLVNTPSDSAGERAVGNVVIVTRHESGAPEPRLVPQTGNLPSCVVPIRRDTTRTP
ncbi:MAG: phosphodiester glycosidase family protein [Gemmatimonadaceae bacterium]